MEDWYVETGEALPMEEAFPRPVRAGLAVIQTVPSGPSYPWQNYQRLVVSAIHRARRKIVITTPYLIPDDEMLHALETAALGGVRIQLVIPERSDQLLVGRPQRHDVCWIWGEIYCTRDHIIHSKTMVLITTWLFGNQQL